MPSDPRGGRSTAGVKSWGASSGRDPISPELVLVAPPEEARRAREQLAEFPGAEWDDLISRERARRVRRPPELPPPPASARRRRRWARRSVLVGALLIFVASAVTVGLAATRDNGGDGAARRAVTPVRHQSSTTPSTAHVTTAAKKPQKSAQRPSRPAPKRTARPKAHATPNKTSTKPTRPRRAPRRIVAGFVPARTWSWEPQSRTRRYVFTLQRNGKRVMAARTTKPRFVLPERFQFAAGRYRWRVVAVGARRKVVVDSKFRLSATGAAAANQ